MDWRRREEPAGAAQREVVNRVGLVSRNVSERSFHDIIGWFIVASQHNTMHEAFGLLTRPFPRRSVRLLVTEGERKEKSNVLQKRICFSVAASGHF